MVVTIKEKILRHLQSGHSINNLIAIKEYGTWSLPYHIFALRRDGHKIRTRIRPTFNGQRFAEYYMSVQPKEEVQ